VYPLLSQGHLPQTTKTKPKCAQAGRRAWGLRLHVVHTFASLHHRHIKSIAHHPNNTNDDHHIMTAATAAGRKRRRWPFLLLPYVVGITWTCVHPILSIITGEAKCRGWFIDESSLDTGSLRLDAKYLTATRNKEGSTSLCKSLLNTKDLRDNIECFRHDDEFEVAKIVPVSNSVEPAEVIVLVVSAPEKTWTASDFHNAILQLIIRLSMPSSCPWLAKTVLVVSPTRTDVNLHSTVSLFLDSYLGSSEVSLLPMRYSSGILRNLLVVDVRVNETETFMDELRILPQGRHGVLPNMDLVFATMSMYSRSSFIRNNMIMHSHGRLSEKWKRQVFSSFSPAAQQWAFELGSMFLFMYHLAMGPAPPHFVALEKGVDSVTIEADLYGARARSNAVECVQKLEGVVRALSNLHERLHHSITQYLLPSPLKFVSHAEYLLPNLLILLPLVIRAATLVLFDISRFDFSSLRNVLLVALASLLLSLVWSRTRSDPIMNALYVVIYATICFVIPNPTKKERHTYGQSLQFITCLVAIYIHVPLVLAHVTLAFPSALVWSALIAFPAFPIQVALWQKVKRPIVLAFAMVSLALVPNGLFCAYTPFVTLVCMPLHILVSMLWLI